MIIFLFLLVGILLVWCIYLKQTSSTQMNDMEVLKQNNINDQKQLTDLERRYQSLEKVHADIMAKVKDKTTLQAEIRRLKKELDDLSGELLCESIDISEYDNITSEECKNKLMLLRKEYSEKLKNLELITGGASGPKDKKGRNNTRQICTCFEAETQIIINNLTFKNVDTARNKLQRAFEKINTMFSTDNVQLQDSALEYKLQELTLVYAYLQKKEQEKEEQKAIREQMVEEEKVRREIEKAKTKIEKEETQFKNEISKLMLYMQKADDIEKQLYVDKIKELEEKLKAVEKDKEDVLHREQNTRAGFVYVISNIGSFGDDVYKIGMTRRLEPMDRINELSNASVPFEFDVHAMIFSEDAPALENILHTRFKDCQVNKVNTRKEFFKVSLDEIEKVVKQEYNATITFTKVAEALQYRQSLKLANVN